jgi:hypothetical protein
MRIFRGREDIFACQRKRENGDVWWEPIRLKLNRELILDHIAGNITIGIYPHLSENRTYLACFDIDVKGEFIDLWKNHSVERKRMEKVLEEISDEFKKRLEDSGFSVIEEFTGGRGIHIWFFFEESVETKRVRRYMMEILKNISVPREFSIELFPKSDTLKSNQVGNLIKLPLGIHQKTGMNSKIINCKDGKVSEFLSKIRGGELMENLKKNDNVIPFPKDEKSAENSALNRVISGCSVLSSIINKIKNGEEITPKEEHVFIYILGLLGKEGWDLAEGLLVSIGRNREEILEKLNGVPPTAIGCKKIKKHLRDTIDEFDCNCVFSGDSSLYDSPLLYGEIQKCNYSKKKKMKGEKKIGILRKIAGIFM